MKTIKLFFVSMTMLALTGLTPAAAQREPPAREIFNDFCEEILQESMNTADRLDNAREDKAECAAELRDCPEGFFNDDPVSCLVDLLECSGNAEGDAVEACGNFSESLADAYSDALRKARREGPGVERRLQRLIDSNRGDRCLAPAQLVTDRCAETDQ